ncbi:MAG: hypothetical protein KDJ39_09160, partial [Gammaproteobacteria bacterium]|nr:hypothetical protein [Gammaproteobacteria bacterium]
GSSPAFGTSQKRYRRYAGDTVFLCPAKPIIRVKKQRDIQRLGFDTRRAGWLCFPATKTPPGAKAGLGGFARVSAGCWKTTCPF